LLTLDILTIRLPKLDKRFGSIRRVTVAETYSLLFDGNFRNARIDLRSLALGISHALTYLLEIR
jgi:hypothetical protein